MRNTKHIQSKKRSQKKQAIFLRPRSRSRVKPPSYAQLRTAVDLETAQPKMAWNENTPDARGNRTTMRSGHRASLKGTTSSRVTSTPHQRQSYQGHRITVDLAIKKTRTCVYDNFAFLHLFTILSSFSFAMAAATSAGVWLPQRSLPGRKQKEKNKEANILRDGE